MVVAVLVILLRPLLVDKPSEIWVRNESDEAISNVVVHLSSIGTSNSKRYDVPVLDRDDVFKIRNDLSGDLKAKISFEVSELVSVHNEDYIDLWPSDVGTFSIGRNGVVTFSYEIRQKK